MIKSIKQSKETYLNDKKGIDKSSEMWYNVDTEREVIVMREKLIDRMIHIYGFENPIVIEFCKLCEKWEDTNEKDKLLEAIVKSHEEFPQFDDEDEEEDA